MACKTIFLAIYMDFYIEYAQTFMFTIVSKFDGKYVFVR